MIVLNFCLIRVGNQVAHYRIVYKDPSVKTGMGHWFVMVVYTALQQTEHYYSDLFSEVSLSENE